MRLNLGLIGLGRLGKVYARDLSSRLANTRLAAVADVDATAAKEVAATFDVSRSYTDPRDLLADGNVDAVVIASPTHTHKDVVIAAVASGKPTFCEKPLALSLDDCRTMQEAVNQSGTFFQMGFMRRFDPGYAAGHQQIAEGRIGRPVVFKATSRDPFRPSLEYANPASSGGILVDMGIHDFDLARWFMGEVKTVSAIGGVLAYPELGAVGDIDNAIISLVFESG